MEELGPSEPLLRSDGKPEGYLLGDDIRVIGPYEIMSGGCDRLGLTKELVGRLKLVYEGEGYDDQILSDLISHLGSEAEARKYLEKAKTRKPNGSWGAMARTDVLVREYAKQGHVIFEGLLVSGIFERWSKVAEDCGGFIWAFFDTPLEVCRQRISQRNKGKSINVKYLEDTINRGQGYAKKAEAAGQRVVWIDHCRAFEQVIEILEGRLPPAAAPSPSRWNSSRLSPF